MSLEAMLANRFSEPEWMCFFEVTAGTRRFDAVAQNLWPSRGYATLGFEIKRSRSDWLAELRQPEKAETMHRHCNAIYLVAADKEIVQDDLPAGWGLMVPRGTRLHTLVQPAKKAAAERSSEFWIRLLRQQEYERQRSIQRAVETRTEELRANMESSEVERLTRRIAEQEKTIAMLMGRADKAQNELLDTISSIDWLSERTHWERVNLLKALDNLRQHHWWQDRSVAKRLAAEASRLTDMATKVAEIVDLVESITGGEQ